MSTRVPDLPAVSLDPSLVRSTSLNPQRSSVALILPQTARNGCFSFLAALFMEPTSRIASRIRTLPVPITSLPLSFSTQILDLYSKSHPEPPFRHYIVTHRQTALPQSGHRGYAIIVLMPHLFQPRFCGRCNRSAMRGDCFGLPPSQFRSLEAHSYHYHLTPK